MNKPNITEGKWKIKRSEKLNKKWHRIASIGNREIVSFHANQYGSAIANAKAISAVPYMIEALISTHRYHGNPKELTAKEYRQHIDKVNSALEKAGVEL